MSLIGALNAGKTALAVHQAAIQVTSNNVANAGNAQYTRQTATLSPAGEHQVQPGMFIGTGVNLTSIQRQIDEALEGRIRGSISDSSGADTREQWLGRVEAIFTGMGDDDLANQLSQFFNSWSNLANKPQDIALRQVVVQYGEALGGSFRDLMSRLSGLQEELDSRLSSLAQEANSLSEQVANMNEQIVAAEAGVNPSANGLRDQRDALLKRLSELMDVKVQDMGGSVNVLVGSAPLILGTTNRGVALEQQSDGDALSAEIVNAEDSGTLPVSSGQIGALMSLRGEIDGVVNQVNDLAGNLIFELNKLHGSGQGLEGFSQVTASNAVADTTAALSDSGKTGLEFAPKNGSFVIHVKQKANGTQTSTLVPIDLDGLNADDTTLQSLAATLDGVDGVAATIVNGKLQISAETSAVELTFSQDSSGVLAALGVNAFFTGTDARDMAVNTDLKTRPSLLAAAMNGESADNQTARAIAALENQAIESLNGASLKDNYQGMINAVAVAAAGAKTNAEASATVKDTLLNQREALSGVSLDEEAINLLREQRAFQAASRVIAAVDELMKTLLELA